MAWLSNRVSHLSDGVLLVIQAGNTAAMMDYQKNLSDLWAKHDIHPLKSMRSIVFQAPLFLCMFAGLRHMAFAKVGDPLVLLSPICSTPGATCRLLPYNLRISGRMVTLLQLVCIVTCAIADLPRSSFHALHSSVMPC